MTDCDITTIERARIVDAIETRRNQLTDRVDDLVKKVVESLADQYNDDLEELARR